MTERLYKSKNNKMIAGVCGGIAEYFNVDATLIRLAWLLAVFFGGSGLVLYIMAMIIVPERKPHTEERREEESDIKNVPDDTAQGEPQTASNERDHRAEVSAAENIKAENTKKPELPKTQERKRKYMLGLILVALGGYFILQRFMPHYFNLNDWWPIILIIIGVVLLFRR